MNPLPPPDSTSRRSFLTSSIGLLALPTIVDAAGAAPINRKDVEPPETIGPVLGHIDEENIYCFIRPAVEGRVTLVLKDVSGRESFRYEAVALPENDLCARFEIRNLQADTVYVGEFLGESGRPVFDGARFEARTASRSVAGKKTVIAMGSCVSSTSFDEIWKQISNRNPECFCLLGDTPYIDSNDLKKNRDARRIFWGYLPSLVGLAKRIPFWNTWDDHDFGRNDSDGLMPLKENIRKAFVEYTALKEYGEAEQGIYTRFRRGPVELWLIDDRWFSQTEPSWADPNQATCIGKKQWDWLKRSLESSDAPFKVLCTGMVWYPKGNKEKDHWETYSAEREAIFSFIKKRKILGVILVSGDIHVSRHHDYGKDRTGYPLHECVVSPMHASVIPSLDVKHPARVWSKPEPNVFLILEADQQSLAVRWVNMGGEEIHRFSVTADELRSQD